MLCSRLFKISNSIPEASWWCPGRVQVSSGLKLTTQPSCFMFFHGRGPCRAVQAGSPGSFQCHLT
jgi:hypothetical protein